MFGDALGNKAVDPSSQPIGRHRQRSERAGVYEQRSDVEDRAAVRKGLLMESVKRRV